MKNLESGQGLIEYTLTFGCVGTVIGLVIAFILSQVIGMIFFPDAVGVGCIASFVLVIVGMGIRGSKR